MFEVFKHYRNWWMLTNNLNYWFIDFGSTGSGCWVFVAVCMLSSFVSRVYSLVAVVWASHCSCFSCCRARILEHMLSGCGTQASLPWGMWDFHRPGIRHVSPALSGGVLTYWTTRQVHVRFWEPAYQHFTGWSNGVTSPLKIACQTGDFEISQGQREGLWTIWKTIYI